MDIEGYDYEIMNGFKSPNGIFAKENVTFCQIDVEFHNPTWKGKGFHFGHYFQDLLRKSSFVPVQAYRFLGNHRKVTFVDAGGNGDCEKMFEIAHFF